MNINLLKEEKRFINNKIINSEKFARFSKIGMFYIITIILLFVSNITYSDDLSDKLVEAICKHQNFNEIKAIIEKEGADVNKPDHRGWFALIEAAGETNLELVKYLVERGANVNVKQKDNGATPLIFAVCNGKFEIVKYLIKKGADINAKDNEGDNAVDIANLKEHYDIANYIDEKIRTVYLRKGEHNYQDTQLITGDWDYGSGQFNEIEKGKKIVFTCTLMQIEKIDDIFIGLFFTTKYTSYLDKHTDGIIWADFSSRPKVNTGEIVFLACRYNGTKKYTTSGKKRVTVPRFTADIAVLRPEYLY